MKYGFFLGCNMPAIRPDVERAIRLTMPELGVDLEDLPGYVCCPAFGTFPSLDEDAQLAVNAWNLSIGEANGMDLMVECGSCYSSLRTGSHMLTEHPEKKDRINKLLEKSGKSYEGRAKVRHISDVLYSEVGVDRISSALKKTLEGKHGVVQYPCHTLYPSEIVGFEESSARPQALGRLLQALGAEVDHFSLEYECCGGAGGFHRNSRHKAEEFADKKFQAIVEETQADFIVVSCITCLMHLDKVQTEIKNSNGGYSIPVFDYSQLLALCMGFPASEVAAISYVPRDGIIKMFG